MRVPAQSAPAPGRLRRSGRGAPLYELASLTAPGPGCPACPWDTQRPPHHPSPLDTRFHRDVRGPVETSGGLRWEAVTYTLRTHRGPAPPRPRTATAMGLP